MRKTSGHESQRYGGNGRGVKETVGDTFRWDHGVDLLPMYQ
jgi:hypothetical protein